MCTSDWVKPKASILKGIFDQWTKDVFYLSQYKTPDISYTALFDRIPDMHVSACIPRERNP